MIEAPLTPPSPSHPAPERRIAWLPEALWKKSLREAWRLGLALTALMFLMEWLRVWMTGQVNIGALGAFLKAMPPAFERLAGVPVASIATPVGRIAMGYVDPGLMLAAVAWSIARSSDTVSGEIGRGTMEILLAQPVRRFSVVVVPALVTTFGSALLASATWLGTWAGLRTFRYAADIDASVFVPAAINLWGLMFFFAGVGTLISACDAQRSRTIGILGGFYILQSLIKVAGRATPNYDWLLKFTILTVYEPQKLVLTAADAWTDCLAYLAWLVSLGLLGYLAAIVVFVRRDLPAPA